MCIIQQFQSQYLTYRQHGDKNPYISKAVKMDLRGTLLHMKRDKYVGPVSGVTQICRVAMYTISRGSPSTRDDSNKTNKKGSSSE